MMPLNESRSADQQSDRRTSADGREGDLDPDPDLEDKPLPPQVPAGTPTDLDASRDPSTKQGKVKTSWLFLVRVDYRKTSQNYEHIFHYICVASKKRLDPAHIVCNFEFAMIKAVKGQFPDSRIVGCLFHFKQAFGRKALKLKSPKKKWLWLWSCVKGASMVLP
ncbi:Hypothetical protein PHPALM_7808 [Phytophthora palmivora]|uniref:MULE transposase domain-containing protein n=1 Tax=Phytophthora palmivora TaxID=4796 RepID=A0A2P4YBE8_9STRA|nr:Hypothetical protein PHPALM_7808 [Phytophthora palmivora]